MFTIPDLCPVCQKPLESSCTDFFCDTVKKCPEGHYMEEIYPLLDTVIITKLD